MEKELDQDVIRATQTSLGKYVKRPPLSEKLLKKPPFRFLHDIITTILKTTGFFEGLFDEEELISDNVKEREHKIIFLNKVITVLGFATGKTLSIKPSKIVAGQEPGKTNELLQILAQALDKKISSSDAVKKFKENSKDIPLTDKKGKETVKSVKKINETKKLTSKSTEKLVNQKRDSIEKSLPKNENDIKQKRKENGSVKTENTKKIQQTKAVPKKSQIVAKRPPSDKSDIKNSLQSENNLRENEKEEISRMISQFEENPLEVAHLQPIFIPPKIDQDEKASLSTSFTIAENDLNSSLSSQDLMEAESSREDTKNENMNTHLATEATTIDQSKESKVSKDSTNAVDPFDYNVVLGTVSNNTEQSSSPEAITSSLMKTIVNISRPPSVRPSSSRPGAPRLKEKVDNTIIDNTNILLGKVNIIVESEPNEEEEDTSVIIVEQTSNSSTIQDDQQQLQNSSNEHGHLVQQILNSQKEFSQVLGKTEIEWQFGAQKARDALNQEIEQLKFNIQALSRVANPLGKLLDHIQEDVEVMRQELYQWANIYEEVSKEILKQKTVNEDSLIPIRAKLKQIDADVEEKHDKINDLKILIQKNRSRIEKLLVSGNVQ